MSRLSLMLRIYMKRTVARRDNDTMKEDRLYAPSVVPCALPSPKYSSTMLSIMI
jgi:hypothetical protein